MALITDHTLATYNSPFSIVEMDGFIAMVAVTQANDGGWSAFLDAEKETRILLAVNFINNLTWTGTLNVDVISQAMTWPRDGITYPNGVDASGPVTPDAIGMAMACWILTALYIAPGAVNSGQLKKKDIGDVSLEFTTDADFVAKTEATKSDTCVSTYIPSIWITSSAVSGMGSVGLGRRP